MRARSAFFAGAGTVAIIAIGWQAGAGTLNSTLSAMAANGSGPSTDTSSSASSDASSTESTATQSATATPTPTVSGPADGTYDGAVVDTRYGPSQVQVVFSGGKIADVITVQRQQNDPKSDRISSQADPILRESVLTAQSARISGVGGATYTSQAYLQSVQSALDAAGFTG